MQRLVNEKAMLIPMCELAFINAYGPRVEEVGLGLTSGHAYSARTSGSSPTQSNGQGQEEDLR